MVGEEVNFVKIWVPGIPAPGGSKRAFQNPKTGKIIITDAAGKKNKNWRASVAQSAFEAMNGRPLFNGAVSVQMWFFMQRPKSHFNKQGVSKHAPKHPIIRPDLLKIARSTEDALTGIVWTDDSRTVELFLSKQYTVSTSGVRITVLSLDQSPVPQEDLSVIAINPLVA